VVQAAIEAAQDAAELKCLQQPKDTWSNPVRTIYFSDACGNLKTVIDQVVDDADVTLIVRRDAPNAVILSQDYFDSLMETVHLLRSASNVAHLERSIAQLREGTAKKRKHARDAG
jgi:antitoxin YefM